VREWLEQQTVAGIVEVDDERCGAGFRSVDVLPVDNFFWRFYRLNA
jgi:hypothetical protein